MLFLSIVTKTLHSATMCVVRNNVIRRHCCDRMRNWSGRRGGSAETCVWWWCGRRRWHLSGKAGRQAAALVCSGGKSTLMNWTYLGGTARGRQEWGNGMQLSCGVATSCASGMWKAKHRPCTLRARRTAQPRARPQHPTRPPIKDPLLLQPPPPPREQFNVCGPRVNYSIYLRTSSHLS